MWRWGRGWLLVGRTARQRLVGDRLVLLRHRLLDDNAAARRVGGQLIVRSGFVGRHESGQLKVVENCWSNGIKLPSDYD